MFFSAAGFAQDKPYSHSGLKIPRFVSLAKDEINVRAGPGRHYPIKWVFTNKLMPVEVVREFDNWRMVRDVEGSEGWVFHSLLSGRRTALIVGKDRVRLFKSEPKQNKSQDILSLLDPAVIVTLERCSIAFCAVEVSGFSGWIQRKLLWGVYENEIIE